MRTLNAILALVAALAFAQNTTPTNTVGIGSDTCTASWCQPGAIAAQAQAILDAQVADLTGARDCWAPDARPDTIPATVVVRGAEVHKSVAWEITLDAAFAANEDGDSWNDVVVVAGCDAG